MKTTIEAVAPTVYQLQSLNLFGMGSKKHYDGSYSASMAFDSEDQAKEYLRYRAEMYNSGDSCGSEDKLIGMYEDIENGTLSLDAVTAIIVTE